MVGIVAYFDGSTRTWTDVGEASLLDDELRRVLLEVSLLISLKALVVVVPKREGGTSATAGNGELVDDLFP